MTVSDIEAVAAEVRALRAEVALARLEFAAGAMRPSPDHTLWMPVGGGRPRWMRFPKGEAYSEAVTRGGEPLKPASPDQQGGQDD